MTGPVYYIVLTALLGALVVALALLIRKRKREDEVIRTYQEKMDKLRAERKPKPEPEPVKWRHGREYIDDDRPYIPRYAAGDEMDRLKRPTRDYFGDSAYVAVIIILLVCIRMLKRM